MLWGEASLEPDIMSLRMTEYTIAYWFETSMGNYTDKILFAELLSGPKTYWFYHDHKFIYISDTTNIPINTNPRLTVIMPIDEELTPTKQILPYVKVSSHE